MKIALYALNAAALAAVVAFHFQPGVEPAATIRPTVATSYASQHLQHQAAQRAVMTRDSANPVLTSSVMPVDTSRNDRWVF